MWGLDRDSTGILFPYSQLSISKSGVPTGLGRYRFSDSLVQGLRFRVSV